MPGPADLWFLPLGGCGEIGMNLNLFGHDGAWLMVDCGITFEHAPGSGDTLVQMPDPAFIASRRDQLVGLVATHAHEDHIGAIPYLWPQLRCPVYTTAFTAAVLRSKVASRSNVGAFWVNRETFGDYDFLEERRKYNRVIGADYNLASADAVFVKVPVAPLFTVT